MFSGFGINGADGTEWYFPERLTIDTGAVGNGIANPAQKVLGARRHDGRRQLPRTLQIYAFAAGSAAPACCSTPGALAAQSGIAGKNLSLINRASSYAHNDPAGAYPRKRSSPACCASCTPCSNRPRRQNRPLTTRSWSIGPHIGAFSTTP